MVMVLVKDAMRDCKLIAKLSYPLKAFEVDLRNDYLCQIDEKNGSIGIYNKLSETVFKNVL